jgi:hypothetical protein
LPIKKIFAEDTLLKVSALDAYRSLLYTILAEYCIEAKLEQKADLSEAYYNLGVLYDEPYVA